MVQLPKNCKITYTDDRVRVKMTYATTLPVGEHNGINVFANWQGKRYITFEYDVKYQHNMPMIVRDMYFQTKKKAMLFNRMKKQEHLQKEIDVLSNSQFAGKWDIDYLKHNNQLPPPPTQIELDF
jgi:hypothetical protein